MFRLVEVYGNRLINVVSDTTSMFFKAFSECTAGLADVLTRKGRVLFNATFAID